MKAVQLLVKSILFCVVLTIGLVSCQDSNSNTSESTTKEADVKTEETETTQTQYCFRNEFPHDGSEDKDVLELEINVNGTSATGKYNWLPAFKDQRKGVFRGEFKENMVKGEYNFQQEGTATTVPIEIVLKENQAFVKGGDPALGLEASIAKVKCE